MSDGKTASRRRGLAVLGGGLFCVWLGLSADAAAAEPALLHDARTALGEQIPEVAARKLQALLAADDTTPRVRIAAMMLLGQAYLDEGLYDQALTAIQPLVSAGDAAAVRLRANILAGAGRWTEALPLYQSLAGHADASASVGAAECLHALGRIEEAIAMLEPLVQSGVGGAAVRLRLASFYVDLKQLNTARDVLAATLVATPEEKKWEKNVEGRLLLARDMAAPARTLFEEILEAPEHLPESLLFAATFGDAEARAIRYGDAEPRAIRDGNAEAAEIIEKFIWLHPDSAYLDVAFRRLDEMYAAEENASESELHRWSQSPESRRAALALFYVAKMQVRAARKLEAEAEARRSPSGKIDKLDAEAIAHIYGKAAQSLDVFVHRYAAHPLLAQAYLLQEEVFVANGRNPEAIRALDAALRLTQDSELRAEIELRAGMVHYQQGEEVLAAQLFESAAKRSSLPQEQEVAAFDAALAWLKQRNFDRFHEETRAFPPRHGDDSLPRAELLRGELTIEEGLVHARAGDGQAEGILKLFLHQFPDNPRAAEANLALAELAFASAEKGTSPGGAEQAAEYLQAAEAAPQTPETKVEAEVFAIFLADAKQPRDDEAVIALAQKFLGAHGDSPMRAEVGMKLGQVYFRREDYANAETQFANLAKAQPEGPYAETALFLAGQSAMHLMSAGAVDRALAFFEQVINKRDGTLKLYARQEQAAILQRTGHEREAVALYDVILSAQPPPDAELRQAALCGKGDNLRALGSKDSKKLEAALGVFEELAALPGVLPVWRNQALYKKAKALEQLGRNDEAVDTYYDILEKSAAAGEHEYFWYYKAGFDAAHIFEQSAQWKPAIGFYEKMAKFGGPRAEEAAAKVRQIRLEHFIWD